MMPRGASRAAWLLLGLIALLLGTTTVLSLVTSQADVVFTVMLIAAVAGYALVGWRVASAHPRNPIGWLLMSFGLAFALAGFSDTVGLTVQSQTGGSAAVGYLGMINQLTIPGGLACIPFILLLFPDGRLPSKRWRPVAWAMVIGPLIGVVGLVIRPGEVGGDAKAPNPLGLETLPGLASVLLTVAGFTSIFAALACVLALVLRFRRSTGDERQQIRWLAYVGAAAATVLLLTFAVSWIAQPVSEILFFTFFALIALGVPLACGVAILRYRLYELDIVVKKTVVFGILAAFITGAYLLVVIGVPTLVFGRGGDINSVVPFLAAAALALLFQPVRAGARHFANRLVYGKRATPYELLAAFAGRAGGTHSVEDVLPRMARAAAEGTGAASASVWLRVGDRLRRSAVWPPSDGEEPDAALGGSELPALPGQDRMFPVRHEGELLGALSVRASAADPLTQAKEKLLEDLAGQAGLILRNVRLTEELRANLDELRQSRQRLVKAQDEERRRLERNIHDGAQQQLVALAVNLRLARTLSAKDPDRAGELLDRLQTEAQETMENLRDLARGIYPPLLQDKGLAAALEAQARKTALPVNVDPDGVGRYPQEVEAGVYFCILEALQNVAKYAEAASVEVRLVPEDGDLVFTVADDGKGFDPVTTPRGSGLQNMVDRLEALGGSLEIRSSPGEGVTLTGRVPIGSGR